MSENKEKLKEDAKRLMIEILPSLVKYSPASILASFITTIASMAMSSDNPHEVIDGIVESLNCIKADITRIKEIATTVEEVSEAIQKIIKENEQV